MKNFATRLVLLLSTLCLWTSAQAQPGSACPPRPKGRFFGYFVDVGAATGGVRGGKGEKKIEETCWVAGRSASGQNRLESQGTDADITSEYSYTVGPSGISGSARLYGQVNDKNSAGGSGLANLWLMWHDTLTFHSNKRTQVSPGDIYRGNPKAQDLAAGSTIKAKVRLLQNPPQCSGERNEFTYKTGVMAVFRTVLGRGTVTAPGEIPANDDGKAINGNNWFIRAGKCGIPSSYEWVEIPNGYDMEIQISVDEETNASLDFDKSPEGHLKVELSGIRLCVARPEKPSDLVGNLTITAASGADYWCP
jgi:hypothetical protein